jgi:four helix bundle protein
MKIRSHRELDTFKLAFECAVDIFELSKEFPQIEKYSLTDQIRRSSRSVCANLAEAFRKRKYPKHFVSKLSDCEGEASETQVWLNFALKFYYISSKKYNALAEKDEKLIGKFVQWHPNLKNGHINFNNGIIIS